MSTSFTILSWSKCTNNEKTKLFVRLWWHRSKTQTGGRPPMVWRCQLHGHSDGSRNEHRNHVQVCLTRGGRDQFIHQAVPSCLTRESYLFIVLPHHACSPRIPFLLLRWLGATALFCFAPFVWFCFLLLLSFGWFRLAPSCLTTAVPCCLTRVSCLFIVLLIEWHYEYK